jgi:DNA-directed RNA polymerase specialized sigma24 family protein
MADAASHFARSESNSRAMARDPKAVAASFRGFVVLETDAQLIDELKPNHQNVLRLTGSYAEMIERLQVPSGTLRSRLNRARTALLKLRQKQADRQVLP